MVYKFVVYTGWLLVLTLSLIFCFTFGIWRDWETSKILLLWLFMLVLTSILITVTSMLIQIVNGKRTITWFNKYRLSRREYVLLNHWKVGANHIKRLNRKRTRLPWYLLIGEKCGKSTLLSSVGVSKFHGDSIDIAPGPTRTIRWWFFRDLGILDLSSSFLDSSTRLVRTWGRLVRWSKRIPAPSGIIIAISVDNLMSNDHRALHASMRRYRTLVEPLLKRHGNSLPLYIMVTQCDRFPGFSLWHQQISAEQRQQILGFTWVVPPQIDGQDKHCLQELFVPMYKGFSQIRLSMGRPDSLQISEYITLLDFPDNFIKLEPALRYAIASLCEPNSWFSNASLGGVWFNASELQIKNRGRRTSIFSNDLLEHHLQALCMIKPTKKWFQLPRGGLAFFMVLALSGLWIIFSAFLSYSTLHPDIDKLSPDKLAVFVYENEKYTTPSFRYLPFLPLFYKQLQVAELNLKMIQSKIRSSEKVFSEYQLKTLNAKPVVQRERILQLASAINVWQEMQDGSALSDLQLLDPVLDELQPLIYQDKLSKLTKMLLARNYIQQPAGKLWLQRARSLLENLVNHDPDLSWLIAPSVQIPPLSGTSFWSSLPSSIEVAGIWTLDGKISVNKWMADIERSLGYPLEIFQKTRDNWFINQQDAWRKFVIEATSLLPSIPSNRLSHEQLIAIEQNKSPAMLFAMKVSTELSEIPTEQTQPWLMILRQLNNLSFINGSTGFFHQLSKTNTFVRQSFITWLHGFPMEDSDILPTKYSWDKWLQLRNNAVKEAISASNTSTFLIRGLFDTLDNGVVSNPLTEMFPALISLKEYISPSNSDVGVDSIWLLFKNDAYRLLGNAVAHCACWLNSQWEENVISMLAQKADPYLYSYEEQQMLSRELLNNFFNGFVRDIVTVGSTVHTSTGSKGIEVPLTAEFKSFIRQNFAQNELKNVPRRDTTIENDILESLRDRAAFLTKEQLALEEMILNVKIESQPATVIDMPQVFPIGTQLTLHCKSGKQLLKNMNFVSERTFDWRAGQCRKVDLDIFFPKFTARYQIDGNDSWLRFLHLFNSGEAIIDSADFNENSDLLTNLGINEILVRFVVSDPQALDNVFKKWNKYESEIEDVNKKISFYNERITWRQSYLEKLIPISSFPSKIAQCQ